MDPVYRELELIHDTLKQHGKVLGELHYAIYGNGKPGLKVQVDRHDRFIKNAVRAAWIIVTPLLAALGGGLLYLMASIPHQ